MTKNLLSGMKGHSIWLAAIIIAWGLLAGCGVQIETPPLDGDCLLFCAYEYDINEDLVFTWEPYPFPEDVKGSYRISLDLFLSSTMENTGNEVKVAHHWADNPNGTRFTMGAFGYGEEICSEDCSYLIVVQPETYVEQLNPETGAYEYVYTLVQPTDSWVEENCTPEEYEGLTEVIYVCGEEEAWMLTPYQTLMQISDLVSFNR